MEEGVDGMEDAITVHGGGPGFGVFYGSKRSVMLGTVHCVIMIKVCIYFFCGGLCDW